ncbi:MAG: NUDIX hydrolase [Desulfovibrionaceae bacterium]|nr:NUDIX hydrolase [Desulfovibrionaceae bacterium]
MLKNLICPSCHGKVPVFANPVPTADILIHHPDHGIVIITRKNIPLGYALPGGFVDEGEWLEDAALRETMEETSLTVRLEGILGVYSRPDRDLRLHTLTTVFVALAIDPKNLKAADDAQACAWFEPEAFPSPMCFDHGVMLQDYLSYIDGRRSLGALSTEWLATPQGQANARLAAQQ